MKIPFYAPAKPVFDALKPFNAWLVGGAVRDYIIFGAWPKDIDIATNALPEEVRFQLERAGIKTIPTGLGHGTITAVCQAHVFEITTLREDLRTDGRHAEVSFTTDIATDASRRDLTFNALYASEKGEVIDFFGGIEDLKAGRVRFIGEATSRIEEDYLRLLRYVRFWARFGKHPVEPQLEKIFQEHVVSLKNLSKERITQEFMKMMSIDKNLTEAISFLEKIGALKALGFKEVGFFDILPKEKSPLNRLIALFITETEALMHIFVLSNKDKKYIKRVIKSLNAKEDRKVKAYLYGKAETRLATLLQDQNAYWEDFDLPTFPLTGKDVLSTMDITGKAVGDALKAVEKQWLETGFPNKERCLRYLEDYKGKK